MTDEVQDPSAMARALRWGKNQFSLEPQPDQPLISPETGGDLLLGSVPGVGQAMALRDMYRGYKADDPVAMGTAALGLVPFGKLAKPLGKKLGILAGEGPGADLVKLEQAKRLRDANKDPREIWSKTGWENANEPGKDLWHYEIPDQRAEIFAPSDQFGDTSFFKGKVNEFLHHPKLFEKVPELGDIKIDASINPRMKSGFGGYQPGKNLITAATSSHDELRDLILHELQHGSQKKFGFEFGGNRGEIDNMIRQFAKEQKIRGASNVPFIADDLYRGLTGEARAYSVPVRAAQTESRNLIVPPSHDLVVPEALNKTYTREELTKMLRYRDPIDRILDKVYKGGRRDPKIPSYPKNIDPSQYAP
jgi:hypothetical protein